MRLFFTAFRSLNKAMKKEVTRTAAATFILVTSFEIAIIYNKKSKVSCIIDCR
jgi:predicted benzoate:H+ symporter BenE